MADYFPGALNGFVHGIDSWDKPAVRMKVDGTAVIGRPTRGFGDGGTFSYAGKDYSPEPWSSRVLAIKTFSERFVSKAVGRDIKFTFCLAGLYPEGDDGIPHHSDTVPTESDLVFSISFGAPRIFVWRKYPIVIKDNVDTSDLNNEEVKKSSYEDTFYVTQNGDALLFDGYSQMRSTHAVLPVEGAGPRVNLTFRTGL